MAFDAIDHGARTHVTLRHVGLPSRAQVELHEEMWRHWLDRFEAAVAALDSPAESTSVEPLTGCRDGRSDAK